MGSAAGWPPAAGGCPHHGRADDSARRDLVLSGARRPEPWPRHDDLPEKATVVGSPGAPRDAAAQPRCGPSHTLSPSRGRRDATLRHGHSARGRDHGADGLSHRGDCGPRSTQELRSQSDRPFNPRADDGGGRHQQIMAAMRTSDQRINTVFVAIVLRQARERDLDRRSVIAALAIVAYTAHLYHRSARPKARAHRGATLAIGEKQASSRRRAALPHWTNTRRETAAR